MASTLRQLFAFGRGSLGTLGGRPHTSLAHVGFWVARKLLKKSDDPNHGPVPPACASIAVLSHVI